MLPDGSTLHFPARYQLNHGHYQKYRSYLQFYVDEFILKFVMVSIPVDIAMLSLAIRNYMLCSRKHIRIKNLNDYGLSMLISCFIISFVGVIRGSLCLTKILRGGPYKF